MNCREAQSHLFTERDGALENNLRAALDGHLAQCDGCRKVRDNLTTAFAVWRIDVRQVTVPDAEREWHAVRRRIRGGAEAGAGRESRPRRNLFTFLAVPVGAAAAVALAFFVSPRSSTNITPENHEGANVARARAVEVSGSNAPTMVFVDDKSGWTFVWANEAGPKRG
jgi:hypothetical protein